MRASQAIKHRTRPTKSTVAKGVALAIACAASGLTYAQESEEQTENSVFEVIEVTSQKRVQNVMEVPVTVGIVSADLLEESTSISLGDIDKFIPGFDFLGDNSVTQAGVEIRGISSPNISVGGDPSSATFYDDVYMPRAAQNVLFSDIERIEVLKGPQGTLFGRNAALGVVSIIPNKPSDSTEGFAKFSWGTDQLKRYEGMVNVALSDHVFLRVNALSSSQNGFVRNISRPAWNENSEIWDLGATDHQAARFSLLWEISPSTEFQLSVDLDDLNQAPPMAIGVSEFAFDGGRDPFNTTAENDVRDGQESRDMYAVTAKLLHEFDDHWSMKYVASIRDWETVNREDEDGTSDITRYFDTANNEDSDIFYTELQLNYVSDRISAVAGLSYSKEDVSQTTELNISSDTIARLVTNDLNGQIRNGFAQQIAAAIGGNTDANAAAAFGPGATFNGVVDSQYNASGFPIDHIWNPGEWANALNTLGFGPTIIGALNAAGLPFTELNDGVVSLTGDVIYDAVAGALGDPIIFGPSFSGQFWQESVNNTGDFTNFGVFADIDFAVTDKWHIIGGLRYSKDEKDFTWFIPETTFAQVRPGVSNQIYQPINQAASDSWSKVTGRLVTSYEVAEDQMVFASYSTGYKSGGFDSLTPINQASGQEAFAPEDSTNFELGYKAVLWDSVIANISYYRTELDNFQVSVESRPPGAASASPTIINENKLINGLEVDVRWSVNDSLTLGVVTDTRSTDTDTPSFYNSVGDLLPESSSSFDGDTNYTLTLDWLPDVDLGNISVHMDYVYVENTNHLRADILPYELALPAYLKDRSDLNARISITNDDDTLELALWARNLLDERYIQTTRNITLATLGTPFVRINRGREIGMDFKYVF